MTRQNASAIHTRRNGWCYPRPVRTFAEKLLSQQLWCFGRDIRHESGNLLQRYGFERIRPPRRDRHGSTCYRLDQDGQHIALWGFGVFFGHRRWGGIYVNRFDFRPAWAAVESISLGIHSPASLPSFSRPRGRMQWGRAHRLCRGLMRWFADYEQWVWKEVGLDYRDSCVASWLAPHVSASRMPTAWRLLRTRAWDQGREHWTGWVARIRRGCPDVQPPGT